MVAWPRFAEINQAYEDWLKANLNLSVFETFEVNLFGMNTRQMAGSERYQLNKEFPNLKGFPKVYYSDFLFEERRHRLLYGALLKHKKEKLEFREQRSL